MKFNPDYSTKESLLKLYQKPLLELVFEAASIHRKFHNPREVQMSSLLSIKTGGCPEDCGYCPQAARYHTDIDTHKIMDVEQVLEQAKNAKANGSSRLCMGAAWREVRDNKDFDKVVEMVQGVNDMDMEVCCTLGMLTEDQAKRLKNAGLFAYNHNLDSSKEFYKDVISTREYEQRLDTIKNARKAGISVCSGGIIGMGETWVDRIDLALALRELEVESVPLNLLNPREGTPLGDLLRLDPYDALKAIAIFRLILPRQIIRYAGGREAVMGELQALGLKAGINAMLIGHYLTTLGQPPGKDQAMLESLGLQGGEVPVPTNGL